MRNEFVTKFGHEAYEKLPAHVRAQYLTQMNTADGWEVTLGELIKLWSRANTAFLRAVQTPRTKRAQENFTTASPSGQIRRPLLPLWLGLARAASIYKMAG